MSRARACLAAFLLAAAGLWALLLAPALAPPPPAHADSPWSPEEVTFGAGDSVYPSLAIGESDELFLALVAHDTWSGNGLVYLTSRRPGGSWTGGQTVSDSDARPWGYPSVAVDGRGTVYVAWADRRNGDDDVYLRSREPSGHWLPPVRVNDDVLPATQFYPSVAADGEGRVYAAWLDFRGDRQNVYFGERQTDGTWASNAQLSADGLTGGGTWPSPRIAADHAGNVYVVWGEHGYESSGQYVMHAYLNRRAPGGQWSSVRLGDFRNSFSPDVAVNARGDACVSWTESPDPFDWRRMTRVLRCSAPGGGWQAKVTAPTGNMWLDVGGGLRFFWAAAPAFPPTDGSLYFRYRSPGGTLGPALRINSNPVDLEIANRAQVADARGNAWACWTREYNDGWGTRSMRLYCSNLREGLSQGKPAVVLVHGINLLSADEPDSDATFRPLTTMLQDTGFEVEEARLQTSARYTPPIEDNVSALKRAIDDVKSRTGAAKVAIIAYSMGGLVARAYIEDRKEGAYRNDVSHLFTFGTPHGGVEDALVDRYFRLFGPKDVWIGRRGASDICSRPQKGEGPGQNPQPGACEMRKDAMASFNRDRFPLRRSGVTYHAIGGDASWWWESPVGWVLGGLVGTDSAGGNDGVVRISSSRDGLANTAGVSVSRSRSEEVHAEQLGDYTYFYTAGDLTDPRTLSKSDQACIRAVLVEGAASCPARIPLSVASAVTPTLGGRTTVEWDMLLPGQTATRTIPLPGGPALFATSWETGTITATLRDPTGLRIDPAFAVSYPMTVSYEATATMASYYLTSAVAGPWQMALQAASVPTTGTAYSTFAAFDSSITLAAGADRSWYAPGSTAVFTATLSGSPASTAVTATVSRGDGLTNTLALAPAGPGQWRSVYSVPAAPGYAGVLVAASGITTDGTPFSLGESFPFQIAATTITLTSVYSETPRLRSAAGARYSGLTVTVGVNASVSGTFGLSGDLVGGGAAFVAGGLASQGLVTGTGALPLWFDGEEIFASGRSGPYTLTNLLLADQRGATLAVAEASNVYTTAGYDYRSFDLFRSYLPLVTRGYAGGW